jgi:hypothetical protein
MPSILNSDDGVVSGTSGLKTTGGNDGITTFQQNGTESDANYLRLAMWGLVRVRRFLERGLLLLAAQFS